VSSETAANTPRKRAYVLVDGPGHAQTRLVIKEGITSLGRLPSNDVILLGDLVSRNHARILYFNGKVAVQDMDSHNGCWVNGEKVTNSHIDDQDMLRVGNYLITFMFEDEAVTDPPGPSDYAWPASSDTDTDALRRPRQSTRSSPELPVSESGPLPWDVDYRHPDESQALQFDLDQQRAQRLDQSLLLAMLKATEAFTSAKSIDEYAQKITEVLVNELRVSAAGYYRSNGSEDEHPQLICSSGPAITNGGKLQASQSVLRSATTRRHTIFSKDISDDIRFNRNQSVVTSAPNMRALVCAPVITAEETMGALYVSREAEDQFCDREIDVIEAIARLFASGLVHFEQRQKQLRNELDRANLARFHAPQVVEHVLEDAIDRKSLDTRPACICAIRLCGLSAIAEHLDAEQITQFLNAYQQRMASIIFTGHGTISKRDAGQITAVFGAPYSTGKDALRAVSTAKAMRIALHDLLSQFSQFDGLELSIGLSSGRVLCGFVGEPPHREFTAIGRALDTAERLRDSASAGKIVLSPELEPKIQAEYRTVRLSAAAQRTEPEGLERLGLVED